MGQVSQQLSNISTQIEGFSGFDKLGSKLAGAGAAISAVFAAPALALGSSVKAFSDFDQALNQSLAIQEHITASMRDEMSQAAIDLSKTISVSAKDAAASYYFLASAGFSVAQQIGALPVVANFAKAGLVSVNDAAAILTRTQFALGLSSQDAAKNTQNLAMISDVLVKADTLALGRTQEFADALTNKGATAMRTFGISLLDGISILAAYSEAGIRGQEAGTYFEMMIRQFTLSVQKHGQAWKDLGVAVYDAQGKMRSPIAILTDLQNALRGMSDQAKAAAISTLGIQARAQFAILPLLGMKDTIVDLRNKFQDFGGTAEQVAQKQMLSFQEQAQLLWNRITALSIVIGQALAPALQGLAGMLEPVFSGVESLARSFESLPKGMQTAIVGSVALVTALGLLGGALLAAGGGALWVIGQVVVLGPVFASVIGGVEALTGSFLAFTAVSSSSFVAAIGNIAYAVSNGMVPALTAGETALLGWMTALPILGVGLYATYQAIPGVTQNAKDLAAVLSGTVVPAVESMWTATKTLGYMLVDAATGMKAWNDRATESSAATGFFNVSFAGLVKALPEGINSFWDLLSPLGILKKVLYDAAQGMQYLTGFFPSMAKAQADLNDKTQATMRQQAEAAGAFTKVGASVATATDAFAKHGIASAELKGQHSALAKATSEVASALELLSSAYKSSYIPVITDVQTAESNLDTARSNTLSATVKLAEAQTILSQIQRDAPLNTEAITAATLDEKAAKESVRSAMAFQTEAQKALNESQRSAKTISDDLKAADNQYAAAVRAVHEPAMIGYRDALDSVRDAKQRVIDTGKAVLDAENKLAALAVVGVRDQKAITLATDERTAAILNSKAAMADLQQKESDLGISEKLIHAANNELAEDAKALNDLYRNNLTGSMRGFQDALNGVRAAKDAESQASRVLSDAETALNMTRSGDNAREIAVATRVAQEARTAFKLTTDSLSVAEQDLAKNYGVSKDAMAALSNVSKTYSISQQDVAAAMTSLGLKSSITLDRLAKDSQIAYALIAKSGIASANQVRDAEIKALLDQKAAMQAHGSDLTSQQQSTLNQLLAQQELYNIKTKDLAVNWAGAWVDSIRQINTAITRDLGQAFSDLLFNIGKVGDDFKKMGQDVVNIILNHIIAEAIKPLLKSLDGVLASLGSIISQTLGIGGGGGVLGTTVGAAGGAAGTIGSAAGGAASAGTSAAGGAASTVSGIAGSAITGIVGAVSGVVSAISGVVGNFQNAHMETSLNAIEHNTRYTMMYVGERADGGILGVMFRVLDEISFGFNTKAVEAIRNMLSTWKMGSETDNSGFYTFGLKDLDLIQSNTQWSLVKLQEINDKLGASPTVPVTQKLSHGKTAAVAGASGNSGDTYVLQFGNVTLGGSDVDQIGKQLLTTLRQRGIVKQGGRR